jgi:hypothetical protein
MPRVPRVDMRRGLLHLLAAGVVLATASDSVDGRALLAPPDPSVVIAEPSWTRSPTGSSCWATAPMRFEVSTSPRRAPGFALRSREFVLPTAWDFPLLRTRRGCAGSSSAPDRP